MNRQTNARRGVVLLLVLGMLAMFGLVGVTFVLLSGHARRSAEAQAKVGRADNPTERIADDVILQVLRGTNDGESVIGPHSLLEDLYGDAGSLRPTNGVNDDFDDAVLLHNNEDDDGDGTIDLINGDQDEGTDEADEVDLRYGIFRNTTVHESPLVVLQLQNNLLLKDVNAQLFEMVIAIPSPNSPLDGLAIDAVANGDSTLAHVGCVLTMLNGPAAGMSTRIVGYRHDSSIPATYAQLLAFDKISTATLIPEIVDYVDNTGPISFIINGAAFSGTGFGYNPNVTTDAPVLTATDNGTATGNPLALLPNPRAFVPLPEDPALPPFQPAYPDPAGPGGANEDYDAADYQNMLLACVVPDTGANTVKVPIPSLHRPSLVNYWFRHLVSSITWPPKPGGLTDDEFHLGIFMYPYGKDGQKDGTTPSTDDDPETIYGGPSLADIKRIIDLKRRIILRPLHEDHPDFTGSNPHYYPLWDGQPGTVQYDINFDGSIDPLAETFQPQWDVDNDGDGVMDSIWVDVGLPVRSTRDGRMYKPLAAVLCVDLDGRLNLNAHGCLAEVAAGAGSIGLDDRIVAAAGGAATSTLSSGTVPFGQGVGPAEVKLTPLTANLQHLLMGDSTLAVVGRYGEKDTVPGRRDNPAAYDLPPADPLAANKYYDFPGLYDKSIAFDPDTNSGTMSYGTPLDLSGGACVGLDLRGQPLYAANETVDLQMGRLIGSHPTVGLRADNPYESNLTDTSCGVVQNLAVDALFTPNELEAVLRPYDVDADRLPKRLTTLAPDLADHRHEVTTESWSIPSPGVLLPPELRASGAVPDWFKTKKLSSLADLLRAKLVAEDSSTFSDSSIQNQVNTLESHVRNLMPSELIAGLKMDLNRPFGDGRDNNDNRVVDEPSEASNLVDDDGTSGVVDDPNEQEDHFWQVDASGDFPFTPDVSNTVPLYATDIVQDYNGNGVTNQADLNFVDSQYQSNPDDPNLNKLDLNKDGVINLTDVAYARRVSLARQLYARHLYVMMLTLMNYQVANPASPSQSEQDVARRVAQWAVNIVDFRDRDSIMTPFEYDIAPFTDESTTADGNPWDVNGDPGDNDGISEPHIVWGCERPELLISETLAFHDRRSEDLSYDGGTVLQNEDDHSDFDQRYRPQGSLFVELYNPWSENEPLPAELYDNAVIPGVELDRTTHGGNNHPVWRLAIVRRSDVDLDPDDPDSAKRPEIERSVYFLDPAGATDFNPPDDGTPYYPSGSPSSSIQPGKYAVVGPPGPTYIGRRRDSDINKTRHIELDADATAAEPLAVRYNRYDTGENPDTDDSDLPTTDYIQTPVVVEIDSPRLSVSEPVGGYTDVGFKPDAAGKYGGKYDPIQPSPLDSLQDDYDVLQRTGTSGSEPFRVVHLQRLANPLKDYDAETNPYLTVDSMPISITAFNGEYFNPLTQEPGANAGKVQFHSRQRGDSGTAGTNMNVWTVPEYEKTVTVDNAHKVDPSHIFNYFLKHSLGYLNTPFHIDPNIDPTLTTDDDPDAAPGWCSKNAGVPDKYHGSPKSQPFPWLTWLNRPFTSEMEMMLVPRTRSSLLLNSHYNNIEPNEYDMGFSLPISPDAYQQANQPYGHLINFFFDNRDADDDPNWKLHRLLEFVRVKSPFVGTDLQGNPGSFAAGIHDFHPPFNRISKRRDPGRVNLNTIASQQVWQAVRGDYTAPSWDNLIQSRRADSHDDMFSLDAALPTRFANPFRSFAGCYNVPIQDLQDAVDAEVNATMLRPVPATGGGFDNSPLFHYASIAPVNNSDRNPAFRYGLLNRLASTATTRSNVYAVWVTVGYFEVEPVKPWEPSAPGPPPVDLRGLTEDEFRRIYPDGYQLGQELGADTGDVTRHRAFYILDRSIPVGFERGKDHNVENAILLRRIIE